jgi:hypothetical protein
LLAGHVLHRDQIFKLIITKADEHTSGRSASAPDLLGLHGNPASGYFGAG